MGERIYDTRIGGYRDKTPIERVRTGHQPSVFSPSVSRIYREVDIGIRGLGGHTVDTKGRTVTTSSAVDFTSSPRDDAQIEREAKRAGDLGYDPQRAQAARLNKPRSRSKRVKLLH